MIPFDFSSTMESFASVTKVTHSEAQAIITDGETVWSSEVDKGELRCIVLMATKLQQQYNKEGISADGAINVITETKLFFTDASSATPQKQSFITYKGIRYRVAGLGFSFANANQRSYFCTRSIL
jgi:hypothetical protein